MTHSLNVIHAVPLHKIEPFYYSLVNRTAVELTWDYNFSLSIRTHRVTILDLDNLKNDASSNSRILPKAIGYFTKDLIKLKALRVSNPIW